MTAKTKKTTKTARELKAEILEAISGAEDREVRAWFNARLDALVAAAKAER